MLMIFGIVNSLFQGLSIVTIIPILDSTRKNDSENHFVSLIHSLGLKTNLENLLFIYFIIFVVYATFRFCFNFYSAKMVALFTKELAYTVFHKVISAPWDFYLKFQTSVLTNLFSNEYQNLRNLTQQSFRIIQTILLISIELIFSCWLSWKITLLTFSALSLVYFIQQRFIAHNFLSGGRRLKISQDIQKFLNESFLAIKFLKISKQEKTRTVEYQDLHNRQFKNEVSTAKLDGLNDFVFVGSSALVIIGIIYFNYTVSHLEISNLFIVLLLLSRVISQIQGLLNYGRIFMNYLPAYVNYKEIENEAKLFNVKTDTSPMKETSIHSITANNLSFSYGSTQVFRNLSFHFERGKMYLLFGPSGKGKTTTLDILSGLLQPSDGELILNNKITTNKLNTINSVSYVLQDTLLFEGTLSENISMKGNYSAAELEEIIEKVGLNNLISSLPNGLDTRITEGSATLSGGEKQRIAIARALLKQSDVLLLDEITSALDIRNEQTIMELLHSIKTNKIIVIVGHRESLKDWVDEVIYYH